NGNLPTTLRFFDAQGRELSGFFDLGFLSGPQCDPGACPATWRVAGDAGTDLLGSQAHGPTSRVFERARAIALRDPFVRRLLRRPRYSISPPAIWLRRRGGVIGALLDIHIVPHGSFDEDWLLSGCSPTAACTERVVHFAIGNVSELTVSVDTRLGHVVGVDPA